MKSALRSTKAPSRQGVWMGLYYLDVLSLTSANTYSLYILYYYRQTIKSDRLVWENLNFKQQQMKTM